MIKIFAKVNKAPMVAKIAAIATVVGIIAAGAFYINENPRPAELHTLNEPTPTYTAIAYSPDGTTITTASYDRRVILWDTNTGRELHTFTGHNDSVTHAVYSPDGITIATASDDSTAKIWATPSAT